MTDAHLLIAEANGLAGLGLAKGYDELLYKLCDALDEVLADRDEGWRQHNQAEIGRLNAEASLRKADKAISLAHDAMWAMDFDKTSAGRDERDEWKRLREQASDAIWKAHDVIRPVIPEALS